MKNKSLLFVFPMMAMALTSCGQEKDPHNLVHVDGVDATCVNDGVKEHYHCDHCDKDFKDDKALEEMNDVTIPAIGHDMSEVKGNKTPTCLSEGTLPYYTCSHEDGIYYKDALGNEKYESYDDIVLPLGNHTYRSLVVSGEYKKNYVAFEEFDASNLVVKAKCNLCQAEHTLNSDEYVISYQSFGSNSLKVGDTKVYIYASDYDISYEIKDLTVEKISVTKPNPSVKKFSYDGNEKTLDIEENVLYEVTNNVATDAGTYRATVSLKDKDNYKWADSNSDDFEIEYSITKASNSLTGVKNSYETNCGIAPDFSEISTLSDHVEYHYYSDENLTTEVQVKDLKVGTYYVKVISGGENYEEVSATASINVSHNFAHHEKVDETIFSEGKIEYWGCDGCGLFYKDAKLTKQVDDVSIPASNAVARECAIDGNDIAYTEVQENAPSVFTRVNKVSTSLANYESDAYARISFCKYYSQIVLDDYREIAFAIKASDTTLYLDGSAVVVEDHSWVIIDIVPLGDHTYHINCLDEEGESLVDRTLKYDSNTDTGYVVGGLNNLMYKAEILPAEHTDNFLATEIKVCNFPPIDRGEEIASCAMNSNGISYEKVATPVAPEGFSSTNKLSVNGERLDTKYYSNVVLKKYEEVSFAIRADEVGYLLLDGWGLYVEGNTWVIISIKVNSEFDYNLTFTLEDGTVKGERHYVYAELAGEGYVLGGLNNLMFKADVWAASQTNSFYVTELRGVEKNY